MYEVIGTRASRALRVLWMLEEMNVPYTHTACAARSDAAFAANPSGKIPAMRVDAELITDSVAIMTFLGDKHSMFTHPAGTVQRARQDALTLQILDDIDGVLWATARHTFILPEEHRIPAIKIPMKWEYARNLARLSVAMQGPFLMGDDMTIPDMLLAHCMRWAEVAKFPDPDEKLADFKARMEAREAFQRAVAMP
ncbi:glutathione S-transferase family protein [Pseudohalocynthiibacter aestuariivivens]|uniref:Glutathione S-transferase family protein n=1 Tax=Roseovarius pelagicus TaxID=2980108 RepID=A0ABY6D9B0_9RHOB|nr:MULTISPECIES: glutathione S-transferase family protein [Rhodobacterales]QIE45407.1 glutathione S-transferase family protein [Pseudohalocynthiibacter aestuariivivens]UXX82673.1 glutathione S-transferase family protein [Roseovarius pelagicus]